MSPGAGDRLSSLIVAVNLKSLWPRATCFPGFTGSPADQRCLEFAGVELALCPINLALNAVPATISYKLVGRRFTLYSCLTIV